ncbi:hypothetical protein [Gloeobacter kilaueensis]|uniref:Uncharacterized protein n=1 Tax=Gloeobacter kilaueensis (strain ATCC BAA-2537 / CCAP 1431/1 / ULC 316 / JS1) TaxID=1183438 RepID=U5QDU8_GLOK1|nr:hypothetical protein [Gloeobacter kilaueensis]AGY57132.1 hypothetical protein GKIL_0886 [Gloeobacter kilaueensis JS1]
MKIEPDREVALNAFQAGLQQAIDAATLDSKIRIQRFARRLCLRKEVTPEERRRERSREAAADWLKLSPQVLGNE